MEFNVGDWVKVTKVPHDYANHFPNIFTGVVEGIGKFHNSTAEVVWVRCYQPIHKLHAFRWAQNDQYDDCLYVYVS